MGRKIARLLAGLLVLCLPLSGCQSAKPQELQVFVMDTIGNLSAWGESADLAAVSQELRRLEGLFSVIREDSEIARLNRGETVTLSPETLELLEGGLALGEELDGALALSLYPISRAWGFTTGDYRVPGDDENSALLALVDDGAIDIRGNVLTLPAGMELDLGGLAKGYAADRCADLLRDQGASAALLDLGGSSIRAVGEKPGGEPWRIALRDPVETGQLAGVLETGPCAVSTSGGYMRYFTENGRTYWHILDPRTGRPAESGLLSATVLTSSALTGDALSTALFVLGKDRAVELWRQRGDFEMLLVDEEQLLWATPGAASQFTPTGRFAGQEVRVIAHED